MYGEAEPWFQGALKEVRIQGFQKAEKITTEEKILYLTPEQEKDKSHFTDKEVCKVFFA